VITFQILTVLVALFAGPYAVDACWTAVTVVICISRHNFLLCFIPLRCLMPVLC